VPQSREVQAAQAAQASQAARVTPYAATGVDNSSPEAFIRSVAPYAQRVSAATGIPAEALIGMAANETGYGRFAEGNNLFGIKGTGPAGSFSTVAVAAAPAPRTGSGPKAVASAAPTAAPRDPVMRQA